MQLYSNDAKNSNTNGMKNIENMQIIEKQGKKLMFINNPYKVDEIPESQVSSFNPLVENKGKKRNNQTKVLEEYFENEELENQKAKEMFL